MKRNIEPLRIAASLNLPVKTVHHFIDRFKTEKNVLPNDTIDSATQSARTSMKKEDFLDIFVFTKTRYSVVDISGSLDKQHISKLVEALHKIMSSHRNPFVLKMTDIHYIDSTGVETIVSLHAECKQMGRYCAILDPSAVIEPVLKQFGIDKKIPIFGTELGFEEHAFK
jgi:anti-anti-sigma factor